MTQIIHLEESLEQLMASLPDQQYKGSFPSLQLPPLQSPLIFGAKHLNLSNHSPPYPCSGTEFDCDERHRDHQSAAHPCRFDQQLRIHPSHRSNPSLALITPKMSLTESLLAPTPLRRASLQDTHSNFTTYSEVGDRNFSAASTSFKIPSGMPTDVADSLIACTPPLQSPTPSEEHDVVNAQFSDDPLLRLHWLSQVDLSRFGFATEIQLSPKKRKPTSDDYARSFLVPSAEEFGKIESNFMDAVKRKHRVPSQSPADIYTSSRASPTTRSRHTPKGSFTSFSDNVPVPKPPSTPRVPYKGKFGLHPICGSCKTQNTPYWRDSWSDLFILCNACGLRYSKFKRYCFDCSYVPRKEDKGAPCCTQCASPWSCKP